MFVSRQRSFPRSAASVRAAREFVVEAIAEAVGLSRRDDVRLCVSELATNAMLHGSVPGQEIVVRVGCTDGMVRVEVRDWGAGIPSERAPGPDDCAGRGLALVRMLADDCGAVRHVVGKSMWAEFKVDGPPEE